MSRTDFRDEDTLMKIDPTTTPIKPPLGLYYSFGFGLRWMSPIGPLRFEWGIPITKIRPTDRSLLFEFTIGNFF